MNFSVRICLVAFFVLFLSSCGDEGSGSLAPESCDCSSSIQSSTSVSSSESSSIPQSSSSLSKESSSSENEKPGYVTDSRDGQVYRIEKIGYQTWMAENLNYRYLAKTSQLDSSSFCYDNDSLNCESFGRLYSWSAAMDSLSEFGSKGAGCGFSKVCKPKGFVRGVCPEGWHLPTDGEWMTLVSFVGDKSLAGKELKFTDGWGSDGESRSGNGVDSYAFAALPAGIRVGMTNEIYDEYDDVDFTIGNYEDLGGLACFWTSSEYDDDNSYYWMFSLGNSVGNAWVDKSIGCSVRCVKDSE